MQRTAANIAWGPALGGLLCVLLLAACATTPPPEQQLVERGSDTDYELEAVLGRLEEAESWEARGNRELASAIYDTTLEVLPAERQREQDYVRCLQAALWGRQGEGRDEGRAREVLQSTSHDGALPMQDPRLAADMLLALAVIEGGAGGHDAAEALAEDAFERLASVDAHFLIVDARLGLAEGFHEAAEHARARRQARRALHLARRLSDNALISATVSAAGLLPPDERAAALRDGYEACYRVNDDALRAVVIATAVQLHYDNQGWVEAVSWGDRIRDIDTGEMPEPDLSGLYEEDYLAMRARYALAAIRAGDRRAKRVLDAALEVIDAQSEELRAELAPWREKLAGALLQPDGD